MNQCLHTNLEGTSANSTQQYMDKVDLAKTNAPIGLFDSGVGGLSIYQQLLKVLPNENYIYYADTLNVPYGNRSFENIEQLTLKAVAWLVEVGCKLIVIACNSASTHSLDSLRLRYPHIPIVGLVPALKPAVLSSQTRHVAVLATKATLEGKLLNQVITDYATPHNVTVTKWSDPNLVPWVESGMPENDPTAIGLIKTLNDNVKKGVDHVVLGCTHYPFFRYFMQRYIDENNLPVTLVDSGEAIATRVQSLLMNYCLQIVSMGSNFENNTSSELTAANITACRDYGTVYQHKLRFFSTKNEPYLRTLVMQLINDDKVCFI